MINQLLNATVHAQTDLQNEIVLREAATRSQLIETYTVGENPKTTAKHKKTLLLM